VPVRRLLGHSLKPREILFRQVVQVGQILHETGFNELIYELGPQAVYVHCVLGTEVSKVLLELGRT
jgi:hypothetical protein